MKFSFNGEYESGRYNAALETKKQSQLVGSIKRNHTVSRLHSQEETREMIDIEDLENVRLSKLTELNERLNRAINKENIHDNASSSARIHFGSTVSTDRKGSSNNILPQSLVEESSIKYSTPLQEIQSSEEEHQHARTNPVPQLERLFAQLDANKVGKLSRTNCRVKDLSEELKFIFGGIFTKIFLKNLSCNKR